MKTLFFIAALAGAVYLIMQTPAGHAWLEESDPQPQFSPQTQQKIQQVEQVSTQVMGSLENKVTELAQNLNQKQQAQIDQLESRIAELENELIIGRIAQKQQPSVADGVVTIHPYNQTEQTTVTSVTEQGLELNTAIPNVLAATSDNQLQRKRQARLQDIANKMEMSSLQALVN
jgi:glutathione S-transferase